MIALGHTVEAPPGDQKCLREGVVGVGVVAATTEDVGEDRAIVAFIQGPEARLGAEAGRLANRWPLFGGTRAPARRRRG